MLLENKVIFITGGTSGIGKATVLTALREGAKVCFTGLHKEDADLVGAEALKAGYNIDNMYFLEGNIAHEEDVQKNIEECVAHFGKLDGVFANAGKHMVGNIVETTLVQWRDMFAVDVE